MTRIRFADIAIPMAARQHGVVARRQLRAAGITDKMIEHRLRTGRLHRLHRGVYLVGPVVSPLSPQMAACLALGPDARLSHRSAAALWELSADGRRTGPIDVAVRGAERRRAGVRTHRLRTLRDSESTTRDGIPVTTPVRTIFDVASVLRPRALEGVVAEAVARRLTTEADLAAMVERRAGRPGAPLLRAVLGRGGPRYTRSLAEERLLELVDRAQLDPPQTNVTLAGHEVDLFWPARRLVVEVDGRAFHVSTGAFERDRRRDADLAARGIRVMRVTWAQLTREPEAVLVRLGAALLAQ